MSCDVGALRRAGALAGSLVRDALDAARPGVSTLEINALVERLLRGAGAEPLFLGYRQGDSPAFPGVCCVSVNEEAVHGVPGKRILGGGDLVKVDIGLRRGGWCADAASSVVVPGGGASGGRARLREGTRRVLELCIGMMRPGVRWSTIGGAAERETLEMGLGLVTEFVGHGVGRSLHEPPTAPCFRTGFRGADFELRAGMVIAVEPILTLDGAGAWLPGPDPAPRCRSRVRTLEDRWTVVTVSGASACHEERTVLVTDTGAEVLTAIDCGPEHAAPM